MPVLTADEVDTALDFDSMAQAGTMLGSGAVIVIDDRACMVQLGLRVDPVRGHTALLGHLSHPAPNRRLAPSQWPATPAGLALPGLRGSQAHSSPPGGASPCPRPAGGV